MTLNVYKYFNNDKIFIKVIALFYICLKTFTRERPITDELKQLASAKNFIEGFSGCYKYLDGSHVILKSSFQWPLFYRFISLPFVFFINNNIMVIYILKVISIIYDVEMHKYAKKLKQKSSIEGLSHEHIPNGEAFLMGVKINLNDQACREGVLWSRYYIQIFN